jgi:1-deoxy-D-xylulose-5-phosphate synthase
MILEQIDSPDDLKELTMSELKKLTQEIREKIIATVSTNGGHLSSNLGVIELSIAVHYCFSAPQDKIIWDVGHQSYTHKILTGRREIFHSLRTFGGISGFPRREESVYDVFTTGHASTSISAALGMCFARDMAKQDYKIVAIIGDGALSGGLAFEALNHLGHLGKDILVILNSNEMAISPTVGALSGYLNRLITAPIYNRLRKDIQELLKKVPKFAADLARRVEEGIKNILIHGALFEELGLRYIGPIDGHNLQLLITTIKRVQELKGPILLHVITKKGYGYEPAEKHPDLFHGIGPFDIATGKPKQMNDELSFSKAFGNALLKLAKDNPKIVAITAAMEEGTGLKEFKETFPERLIDVGIAEEHAVTLAGGMAANGLKPVVAIYSTFLQRAYDEILHDICLPELPVIFCIDRAGLVGEDGATHHGVFDIAYLRHIPNIIIAAPKDAWELEEMLNLAVDSNKPFAIRYPKANTDTYEYDTTPINIGKAEVIMDGKDAYILSVGHMTAYALKAAKKLNQKFSIGVVNIRFVKPLDTELILNILKTTGKIITLEEHVLSGGFGNAVAEVMITHNISGKLKCIGLPDEFIEHGDRRLLLKKYNLDLDGIISTIQEFLRQ